MVVSIMKAFWRCDHEIALVKVHVLVNSWSYVELGLVHMSVGIMKAFWRCDPVWKAWWTGGVWWRPCGSSVVVTRPHHNAPPENKYIIAFQNKEKTCISQPGAFFHVMFMKNTFILVFILSSTKTSRFIMKSMENTVLPMFLWKQIFISIIQYHNHRI